MFASSVAGTAQAGAQPVPVRERIEIPGGATLAVTRFGEGPLLVVLHGGPSLGSAYLIEPLLPLADVAQVVLFDARGAGASVGGGETFGLERLLDDIDAVADRYGEDRFILLGHSWGGFVALSHAARSTARLSGLSRAQVDRARAMGARLANDEGGADWGDVGRIAVPALVVHGSLDVVPVALATALAEALPDARLEVLEDVGHFPMLERPQRFLAAIRSFLRQEMR